MCSYLIKFLEREYFAIVNKMLIPFYKPINTISIGMGLETTQALVVSSGRNYIAGQHG